MPIELKNHYVAFIDILGFSQMVRTDCEGTLDGQKYVDRLIDAHKQTTSIGREIDGLSVSQFSDSTVISAPYSKVDFADFVSVISSFQQSLLTKEILCRGGIAIGKHFSEGSFLFSNGLIEAYRIESGLAVFPRIVVSKDLIDLVYPNNTIPEECSLVKENDNLFFVDYLSSTNAVLARSLMETIIPGDLSIEPSIRSKQLWLIEYYNYCFPENQFRENHRFQKKHTS